MPLRPLILLTSWSLSSRIRWLLLSQTVTPYSNFSLTSARQANKQESHIQSLRRRWTRWHLRDSKSQTFRDYGDSSHSMRARTLWTGISSVSTLSLWTTEARAQWAHWTLSGSLTPLQCAQATRNQGLRFKLRLHRQVSGKTTWLSDWESLLRPRPSHSERYSMSLTKMATDLSHRLSSETLWESSIWA